MANIRSWTQIWPISARLCILNLVLDFKIIALADDSGSSGFAAQNTCKNTNYQSFLPPPYQNISHMPCTLVWHTYELRYIQKDHTTTIILSVPYTIGWVGIGFCKDGMMVGSSAMVGWINKHGHPNIKQFYLRGRKSSEVIVEKGELPLNNVPAAVATNGVEIHLAFQLQMTTPFERQPILLAFGSKYPQNHHLSKHEDKTTIVFDFSAGSKDLASNELIQMRKNHGIVGIIGWGLIQPVGEIVARYFRHRDPTSLLQRAHIGSIDHQNLALVAPAPPNSLIYITLQVRHPLGNEAAQFYQNVFGAIPMQSDMREVGIRRTMYVQLMRTIYLKFNANIIFRVVEVDCNANLRNNGHVIPSIYVDDPAALMERATIHGGFDRRNEFDEGVQLTLLEDPYNHLWTIGSSALAPNLY